MVIVIYNNGSVEKFKKVKRDKSYKYNDFVFNNSSPSSCIINICNKNKANQEYIVTKIQYIWINYSPNTYYFRIAAPAKVEITITKHINQKIHTSCEYFCIEKPNVLLSKLDYLKHLNNLIQKNALDSEYLILAMLSSKFMAYIQFRKF